MDRICTCGHEEGEHKIYRGEVHNKNSKDCINFDGKIEKGAGAMVSKTFRASGCTICNCIAFRLEEARLLR